MQSTIDTEPWHTLDIDLLLPPPTTSDDMPSSDTLSSLFQSSITINFHCLP